MTYKRTAPAVALALMFLAACVSPLLAAADDAPKAAPKPAPKPAVKPAVKPAPKAPADAKPATQPARPKDETVVVTSVTGLAQRRTVSDAKAKWQSVKVGDVLNDLTLIRTGLGTNVVIRMGDRGEVTIKSGTKVGIQEFSKKAGLANMRLGLKYGAMRARVDSSRGKKNDFRVSTPVATLSVRGSGGSFGFGGPGCFGLHIWSGNWNAFFPIAESERNAGINEWLTGPSQRSAEFETFLNAAGIADQFGGLTPEEVVAALNNSGGVAGGFIAGGGSGTQPTGGGGNMGPPTSQAPPPPPTPTPTGPVEQWFDYNKWR